MRTKQLGKHGEELVARHLKKNGFKVLIKNFQTRQGEVDIIARKGDTIAFVEVKTRKKAYFPVSEVVTPSKQRKIVATARSYVLKNGIEDMVLRFDVATVLTTEATPEIEYIEDAFQATSF